MSTHSIRSPRVAPRALARLLLFVTLSIAPAARADDLDAPDGTADGWAKVVAYAGCAFSVFRAVSPGDWSAAFITCTTLLMSESAATGGGA